MSPAKNKTRPELAGRALHSLSKGVPMTDTSVNADVARAFATVLDHLQGVHGAADSPRSTGENQRNSDVDPEFDVTVLNGKPPTFRAVKDGTEFSFFLGRDLVRIASGVSQTPSHDSSPSVDGDRTPTVGDGGDVGVAPTSPRSKSNIADSHLTSRSLSSFTAGGLVFSVAVDAFPGRNSVLTVSNAWAGISMSTELPARRSAGD